MMKVCSTKKLNAYEENLGDVKSAKLTLEGLFKNKTKMDFASYYKKQRPSLVWYLQRYTSNPGVAEDVADEAFVKALEELERYDSTRSQFSTWLFTIAKRLMYQNTRYESRFHNTSSMCISKANGEDSELSTDDAISFYANASGNEDESIEEELLEQSAYAVKHMSLLPSKYSTVLTMRLIDGLSYQEISDYLNTNLSTVKSQVRHGKVLLKQKLLQRFGEDTLYGMAA